MDAWEYVAGSWRDWWEGRAVFETLTQGDGSDFLSAWGTWVVSITWRHYVEAAAWTATALCLLAPFVLRWSVAEQVSQLAGAVVFGALAVAATLLRREVIHLPSW